MLITAMDSDHFHWIIDGWNEMLHIDSSNLFLKVKKEIRFMFKEHWINGEIM